jgi:cell division protein FtsX
MKKLLCGLLVSVFGAANASALLTYDPTGVDLSGKVVVNAGEYTGAFSKIFIDSITQFGPLLALFIGLGIVLAMVKRFIAGRA